jgi:hypothetical protein
MLSLVMLSGVKLSVIMLNVIIPSVAVTVLKHLTLTWLHLPKVST